MNPLGITLLMLAGFAAFAWLAWRKLAIVVALAPKVEGIAAEYLIGATAGLFGALVEAAGTRVDDNLTIPASVGCLMWLLYVVVIPNVNVYALDHLH